MAMPEIKCNTKDIIFQFEQEVRSNGFFKEVRKEGDVLLYESQTSQIGVPRWGVVTHLGEGIPDVKVGDAVLIEAGMWTAGFTIDGVQLWKTDYSKLLAVRDSEAQ